MRACVLAGVLAIAALMGTAACGAAPGAGATSSVSRPPAAGTAGTSTVVGATRTSTAAPLAETVSLAPSTVITTPAGPTLVPPPPATREPAPTEAGCPYLTTDEVAQANGQRVSKTETIATEPYPICVFYRPDGTVMAVTRIVLAASPAAAAAAVNQHVPIAGSFPVTHPAGWAGGAMATPGGVPGYPDAGSIYAVSKGTIAVIAVSNQKQSIKGRQMVTQIVANLGL